MTKDILVVMTEKYNAAQDRMEAAQAEVSALRKALEEIMFGTDMDEMRREAAIALAPASGGEKKGEEG